MLRGDQPVYKAYLLLYIGFIAAPIIAGADKFLHLLTTLMLGKLYDVALRDLGLALGAFALSRNLLVDLIHSGEPKKI